LLKSGFAGKCIGHSCCNANRVSAGVLALLRSLSVGESSSSAIGGYPQITDCFWKIACQFEVSRQFRRDPRRIGRVQLFRCARELSMQTRLVAGR
jgi:hypothetical protein